MKTSLIHFLLALAFLSGAAFAADPNPVSPIPVPPRPSGLVPGQTAPKVTDIWVVFKTHCDLGYTMSADAVNEKFRVQMMDNAIKLMEADRSKPQEERFKWTIAGWPMAANILGPKQDPARKAKIEQGLKDGAFCVHAFPASVHTDAFEPEDFARSLIFASSVARMSGKPLPISAKMTDVPAHSWFLPGFCQNAGIKFLQIGCNHGSHSMLVPPLFWWIGPDGGRVLCNYTPQYGSGITPPTDWPAKNYLAVIMTRDNHGPPTPAEVMGIRKMVEKMPGVTLHFSGMDEFAKAIENEKPTLPEIRSDMVDAWIHGVSSMPQGSAMIREARPLLPALELLDAELRTWGLAPADAAPALAQAYENSMLFDEHTFGASSPWAGFWDPGMPGKYFYGKDFRDARAKGFYKKFEASFADKMVFAQKTAEIAATGLKERLALLANSVKVSGKRVVVYNALPWKRSGIVEAEGKTYLAKNVPPCGYLTLSEADLKKSGIPREPLPPFKNPDLLETKYFKLEIDPERGGISSLILKSENRELVDTSSPYALGQFLHETFSSEQTIDYYNRYNISIYCYPATTKPDMPKDAAYAAISPSGWTSKITRTETAEVLTLKASDTKGLAESITLDFIFPRHVAEVSISLKINGKVADTIPEGGWLCFPFNVSKPSFFAGRLGGMMNLEKDQIPGGNRYLYGIQSASSIRENNGKNGMMLCSTDCPAMSFGEPGLWKYDYSYVPKKPAIFVHLYNNMWNTNFPDWIEGNLNAHVTLRPWKSANPGADPSVRFAWETRTPLLAAAAEGPAGKLPETQSGIISAAGSENSSFCPIVTAFGKNPDAKPDSTAPLLRIWEQGGAAGKVTLTLPASMNFTRAFPVDLRGTMTKAEPLPIIKGRLTIPLKAWQPVSFLLE